MTNKVDTVKRRPAVDLCRQKKHSVDKFCRTVGTTKPTPIAYVKK